MPRRPRFCLARENHLFLRRPERARESSVSTWSSYMVVPCLPCRGPCGVRRPPPAPRRESASRLIVCLKGTKGELLQANDLDARHTLPRVTQCHNSVTVRKYV